VPSAADKARAAELFKKSAESYRQGDFAHAIELLDEAYALDPQPVLVYNRARAAEGIGNLDAAIAGYEKFLADEPNAPDRGAIEQRLVTLRRQRDERAALERERDARREEPAPAAAPPTAAAPTTAPPADSTPPSKSPLPYVVAGVGAAGLVAGTILGLAAVSKNDDAKAEPVQKNAMDTRDSAHGLATGSTVSFIVGGVLVVAGASWWLVDRGVFSKKDRTARLAPHVSATGIGATFP
jgi:tetratricopeptide (TPR) repeat protein